MSNGVSQDEAFGGGKCWGSPTPEMSTFCQEVLIRSTQPTGDAIAGDDDVLASLALAIGQHPMVMFVKFHPDLKILCQYYLVCILIPYFLPLLHH